MGLNTDIAQNLVTTTDATQTAVVTYSVPQNCSAIVTVRVIGVDLAQNTYALEQRYIVKRIVGNCSLVELPTTVIQNADLSVTTASAVLNINGASIEIDVAGVLATAINWAARIDILYLN